MADLDLAQTLQYHDDDLEIHKVVVGPFENNVFVLRCLHTGEAIMFDAANEAELLIHFAQQLGVTKIVQTHGHWDHIQAVTELRAAGFPILVTPPDAPHLEAYDELLSDDQVIAVGNLRLRAILTPGHTPGSVCFKVEDKPYLFSGDTIFPGGPGNTSLDGGDFDQIIESITTRLFDAFPPEVVVMPGHGDDTTLGTERPHLEEWIARRW